MMKPEKIRELIQSALDYDPSYSVDDVLRDVIAGNAKIWMTEESLAIATFSETPQVKRCHIWIAAGNLDELMGEIYPQIEEAATELGVSVMTISGRRGWIRTLKPQGFNETAAVAVKRLA